MITAQNLEQGFKDRDDFIAKLDVDAFAAIMINVQVFDK